MTILVCPRSLVSRLIAERAPERVVSLLDPGQKLSRPWAYCVGKHLCLECHDAFLENGENIVPNAAHVAQLLTFTADWREDRPLLVHCRAGIGRSTAAAFIAACQHNPCVDEQQIARALRAAPQLHFPAPTCA
jgi:predicted protein tyrosine phosphatase